MIIFDISYNSTGIWDGDRDRVRDEEEDGIGNWEMGMEIESTPSPRR